MKALIFYVVCFLLALTIIGACERGGDAGTNTSRDQATDQWCQQARDAGGEC